MPGKPENNPNQLAVEDNDLKDASLELLRHHITGWPETGPKGAPVFIRHNFSADQVLEPIFLDTLFKMPGLRALGVIVDADQKFDSRWNRIRKFATTCGCRDIPEKMPETGLVVTTEDSRRFGAWIMPNCKSAGMLETLCRDMVQDERAPLWKYAVGATAAAKEHGGDYHDSHVEKANIHSWLAWRDPPGGGIGLAIKKKLLNTDAPAALAFVDWCRRLYEI